MTNNDKNTQNMIETNEKKERNKLFSNFPPPTRIPPRILFEE